MIMSKSFDLGRALNKISRMDNKIIARTHLALTHSQETQESPINTQESAPSTQENKYIDDEADSTSDLSDVSSDDSVQGDTIESTPVIEASQGKSCNDT